MKIETSKNEKQREDCKTQNTISKNHGTTNYKRCNKSVMGIPEAKEREKGRKNATFEAIMTKSSPPD